VRLIYIYRQRSESLLPRSSKKGKTGKWISEHLLEAQVIPKEVQWESGFGIEQGRTIYRVKITIVPSSDKVDSNPKAQIMTSKAKTPVEMLGRRFPALKGDIIHISAKWAKRTSKLNTPWPEEGTSCVERCEDLKGVIKNYNPRDNSKKRREKREKELEILMLFEKEGKERQRLYRDVQNRERLPPPSQKLEIIDPNVPQGAASPLPAPPPYEKGKEGSGLYPVITGTVSFEGEIEMGEVTKE